VQCAVLLLLPVIIIFHLIVLLCARDILFIDWHVNNPTPVQKFSLCGIQPST